MRHLTWLQQALSPRSFRRSELAVTFRSYWAWATTYLHYFPSRDCAKLDFRPIFRELQRCRRTACILAANRVEISRDQSPIRDHRLETNALSPTAHCRGAPTTISSPNSRFGLSRERSYSRSGRAMSQKQMRMITPPIMSTGNDTSVRATGPRPGVREGTPDMRWNRNTATPIAPPTAT